jgi:hypothetical protein
MKIELFIFLITMFFVVNTYYDGKYMKILMSWKKYYQMAFYIILAIGIYLMIKKNPCKSRELLIHANNMIKYMPFDKTYVGMLNPIIDLTTNKNLNDLSNFNGEKEPNPYYNELSFDAKRKFKRVVSETKKKYVASQQNWKCGNCNQQLNHTFEIDHKTRLEYGGSNDVSNLIALCRNCHGNKTAMENM